MDAWKDEYTSTSCGSLSKWSECCDIMVLADELGWCRPWLRLSAIISRSIRKAQECRELCLECDSVSVNSCQVFAEISHNYALLLLKIKVMG